MNTINNSFAKKTQSRFTEGSFINEITSLHLSNVFSTKRLNNEINSIKLNIIDALHALQDDKNDKNEIKIGYTFFSRECWGKPFNKEVKTLMMNYILQYVDNVIFHVGAENIRSQKAMAKLGATKIGEEEVAYFGEATRLNFVYLITNSLNH